MSDFETASEHKNKEGLVLSIEPRHYSDEVKDKDGFSTIFAGTRFGNSGVTISIGEGRNSMKNPRWSLHFIPEGQIESQPATSLEQLPQRVKYGRMFAAGMLSLIGFVRSQGFKTAEPGIRHFYEKYPASKLPFSTNQTMVEFAQKMFGEDYFKEDRSIAREGMHYATFNLDSLLTDLEKKPNLLDTAKRFADPDKLREIKVNQK